MSLPKWWSYQLSNTEFTFHVSLDFSCQGCVEITYRKKTKTEPLASRQDALVYLIVDFHKFSILRGGIMWLCVCCWPQNLKSIKKIVPKNHTWKQISVNMDCFWHNFFGHVADSYWQIQVNREYLYCDYFYRKNLYQLGLFMKKDLTLKASQKNILHRFLSAVPFCVRRRHSLSSLLLNRSPKLEWRLLLRLSLSVKSNGILSVGGGDCGTLCEVMIA